MTNKHVPVTMSIKLLPTTFFILSCLVSWISPWRVAAGLTVAWETPRDNRTAGHIVYYGTSPGQYTSKVDVGTATRHQFHDLDNDTTYFFTVSAYNETGEQSGYSPEVSTTNTFRATALLYTPIPALLVYTFRFDFNTGIPSFTINPSSNAATEPGYFLQDVSGFFAEYTFARALPGVTIPYTVFLSGQGNVSADQSISGTIEFTKNSGLLDPSGVFRAIRRQNAR